MSITFGRDRGLRSRASPLRPSSRVINRISPISTLRGIRFVPVSPTFMLGTQFKTPVMAVLGKQHIVDLSI